MHQLDSASAADTAKPAAPRPMRDFAKMVAAAIAVGVTASAAAVGTTLLLTRSTTADASAVAWTESHEGGLLVLRDELGAQPVEAGITALLGSGLSFSAEQGDDAMGEYEALIAAMPGNMYIGGGCESEPIYASERDWHVVIDGAVARITVMQSFVLPDLLPAAELPVHAQADDPEEMVRVVPTWFHTVLPSGAKLLSVFIENDAGERAVELARLTGDWRADNAIMASADEALLQADGPRVLRGFTRPAGRFLTLATDEINAYVPGETVIVRYEYEVQIDEIDGVRALDLPLAPKAHPLERAVDIDLPEEERDVHGYVDAVAPGSVWIEWRSAQPVTLLQRPLGVSIERLPSAVPEAGRITGAAWAAPAIAIDDEFRLRWK
ncbi:MAG: hypothetical protein ACK5UX_12335 [Burkholderiales bacterium]